MKLADWVLEFDEFVPEQVGHREALCTLSNGYLAIRGSGEESSADALNYPGTYIAGGYNRLSTTIAGRELENEDLVNFPNGLLLCFRAAGSDWLNLNAVKLLRYKLSLDMRTGTLSRLLQFEDKDGRRTRIESRRFVHMRHHHIAGISQTITAENWSGPAEIRSAIDGRVINAGVARYRDLNSTHLEPIGAESEEGEPIMLATKTSQSGLVVAMAARTVATCGDWIIDGVRSREHEPAYVAETLYVDLEQGKAIRVEKTLSIYTSRDRAISEPRLAARSTVTTSPGHAALERSQELAWQALWQRADIRITDHDATAAALLRFHSFQLLQTLTDNSADLDVGVPARGLHGEAYRGHVFWDELFVLPFYHAHFPDIARAMIMYRYRRLDMARWRARQAGYAGAMFPWQSGSNGREESQRLHLNPKSGRWIEDHTYLQHHVSSAIAYNVWQHFLATGDEHFLIEVGAEMILEIARFWSSRSEWNTELGRYEIRHVVGPDEYHTAYRDDGRPGIHNNAYTNVMAAWCLRTAIACLETLPLGSRHETVMKLQIRDEERSRWQDVAEKLFVPFTQDGIMSQFEDYGQLEELSWEHYREKYGDIQRLDRILESEGDTANRYKLSKQADVLMLFYLFSSEELTELLQGLGYDFDPQTIPETIDYYLKRTTHGSSLSRVVHSWVLARSDRERSWTLFRDALEEDVFDAQDGTTAEGIHFGAMAATVDLIERCYTGLELRRGYLRLNPRLPQNLRSICFDICYLGNRLNVLIEQRTIRVEAGMFAKTPIRLVIVDTGFEIEPGKVVQVDFSQCRSSQHT